MIIPKADHLTDAQLDEVRHIVGDFDCEILVLHGVHRKIYAIIGDERSETMVNRLLGLEYIDEVQRMESVYRMMHADSALAGHHVTLGGVQLGAEPLFIAGHCTIDPKNPEAFIESAHAIREAGGHVLRGGVWKPRTSPHSFQGDDKSIATLLRARDATGLPVIAEVMDAANLQRAVDAGVDALQVGTRNALNYTLLKEIGRATRESATPVLLKRSRHMGPIDEFIAAAEYIVANGNPNVMLCPRGTMPGLDGYRNHPDESITPLLKRKTWAPVVADPSHAVGRSMYVPACSLAAIMYGADGLILETHVDPPSGIGDDPSQAIPPAVLAQLIKDVRAVWDLTSRWGHAATATAAS